MSSTKKFLIWRVFLWVFNSLSQVRDTPFPYYFDKRRYTVQKEIEIQSAKIAIMIDLAHIGLKSKQEYSRSLTGGSANSSRSTST
jgi:hypothetical protein